LEHGPTGFVFIAGTAFGFLIGVILYVFHGLAGRGYVLIKAIDTGLMESLFEQEHGKAFYLRQTKKEKE
jgi:hypothetical protein